MVCSCQSNPGEGSGGDWGEKGRWKSRDDMTPGPSFDQPVAITVPVLIHNRFGIKNLSTQTAFLRIHTKLQCHEAKTSLYSI